MPQHSNDESVGDNATRILPSEYMRARRPYLFSDGETTTGYHLDRAVFDHHLDTLTNRNQHLDFELFARKISEKHLAANLRPPTGPMGGGDSKADTETYPVAEEIQSRWYLGQPNSGEKAWAFAFSTKKTWSSKVRDDVKGLVDTGRHYDLIYFITSRYARDKDRSRVEDELSEKYAVPVKILDRSWIIDTVFEGDHFDIAYDYLKVGSYDPNKEVIGSSDFKRQAQLENLERELNDDERYTNVAYQRVEDALIVAKLSRGIEKPRFETDGRYERAIALAKKDGIGRQELRATYEYAWTTYWWFDDFSKFNDLYSQVEALSVNSDKAIDLELLHNLFNLIYSSVHNGFMTPESMFFEERYKKLNKALSEVASDKTRPNNALEAETMLLLIEVYEVIHGDDQNTVSECWGKFSDILDRAKTLGEYSAEKLPEIIEIFGSIISDDAQYDELCEKLANFISKRRGEGEAGIILLKRGQQKLEAEKRYDAIKFLGKAASLLIKREYRSELFDALFLIAVAYRGAGLLWSARSTCLAACLNAFSEFEEHDEFIPQTIVSIKLFAWITLELGHIPDFLNAFYMLQALKQNMDLDEESKERFQEALQNLDMALGCYFLNAKPEQLQTLRVLPDALDYVGLISSRTALLYRFGHELLLREEGSIPENETNAAMLEFFQIWKKQLIKTSLPEKFLIDDEEPITLQTKVIGTVIAVNTNNIPEYIAFSQAILATIEAFLATSLGKEIYPHTERFEINVIEETDLVKLKYEFFPDRMCADIRVPSDVSLWTGARFWDGYQDMLMEIVIMTVRHIAMIGALEQTLDKLVEEENVFGRSLNFNTTAMSYSRIFGTMVGSFSQWKKYVKVGYLISKDVIDEEVIEDDNLDEGDDINDLPFGNEILDTQEFKIDHLKHSDQRVLSVIDVPLWDRAGWSGVGFMTSGGHVPPIMAFLFTDGEAATKIFERWRERFGEKDSSEEIRISVLRGVSASNPYHYRVLVTSEIIQKKLMPESMNTYFSVGRIHYMEPDSSENLDRFLEDYNKFGTFGLTAAIVNGARQASFLTHLTITKSKVHIKEAWEVGPNDPELMAIKADDNPIIPKGINNPPILKALARKKSVKKT